MFHTDISAIARNKERAFWRVRKHSEVVEKHVAAFTVAARRARETADFIRNEAVRSAAHRLSNAETTGKYIRRASPAKRLRALAIAGATGRSERADRILEAAGRR